MRIREYKESNYKAIFFNGKTIRSRLDKNKEISSIPFPELEDVAINNKCMGGCPYCYTSALTTGVNFNDIVSKAYEVWGSLELKDRPFQIAVGGAGESTLHPDWIEFMKTVYSLGIVPNYTTNGMHLSDNILQVTEDICGGVALSWHPHIPNVFHKAMDRLKGINTKLNVHVIIGEDDSLEQLKYLYNKYQSIVDYFVILPYMSVGRAKSIDTHEIWINTFKWIKRKDESKFAFGALFYDWLMENKVDLDIAIYPPEIYSGYRLMDDRYRDVYISSYDLRIKEMK